MPAQREISGPGLRLSGPGARSVTAIHAHVGFPEQTADRRGSESMRRILIVLAIAAFSLVGCGLENLFGTIGSTPSPRPASTIQGFFPWLGVKTTNIVVTDGGGNTIVPFDTIIGADDSYTLKLPSSKYQFLQVHARLGDMETRSIVPYVGEESVVSGVNTDARAVAESLIVEARLGADGISWKTLDPVVYEGTRKLIRDAFEVPGPTQDLMRMVERLMPRADPLSGTADPFFFIVPVVTSAYAVKTSPIDAGWIARNPFDYAGTGSAQTDSVLFDQKLAEVAKLYNPAGCPDPARIRLVFTVDFNQSALNGNGGAIDRFKWAKDQPGKQMYFVGWIHKDSLAVLTTDQYAAISSAMGASTPNIIKMYDDGTNGDEVAGDSIWTVTFDVPNDPTGKAPLRIGYKYTWGKQGAPWTGSEEWPGNSRIIEIADVNGDGYVHRRDVFSDEATNKDLSNLSLSPKNTGSITWTTDLRGCGPEAREQKSTLHNAQTCEAWLTPKGVGPITVACTGS
jgi:hypothetical protein